MNETAPQMTAIVGRPVPRVDGRQKVTGAARYAADFAVQNVAHAVAFISTIANGRVTDFGTAAAERAPGVLAIITPNNAPKVNPVTREQKLTGQPGQVMPLLQDDRVHYAGQYLGLVIAETLAQAYHAVGLVKPQYAPEPQTTDMAKPIEAGVTPKKMGRGDKPDSLRGDPDAALAAAAVKVDQTYITPVENHNPMELSATIAAWDESLSHCTLYDATQHVLGVKEVAAAFLGIAPENLRVICPFVGGGFGCKGSVWPHVYLSAIAARHVRRPVKFVVSRQQMFSQVGHRPKTVQRVALAAGKDCKLTAITHDVVSQTSDFDDWPEPAAKQTRMLYGCANVRTTHRMSRVNVNTPCQMRAPGEASGTYALEAAMDELAYALKIDPVELRLRNYAETDEDEKKPYSSKALRECYAQGAERFGWSKRKAEPRSMRDGDVLIGWGMATATYPTNVSASTANVRLFPDGRALVSLAAHDLGTGTYTILTQVAAETLGLPVDRVRCELGDTVLPQAPVAGGSQTAASCGSAVKNAAEAMIEKLAHLAVRDAMSPLHGRDPKSVIGRDGKLVLKDESAVGEPLADILHRAGARPIDADAKAELSEDAQKFSKHAWGAQFAEVRVHPRLGEVRVSRFVGAFAAGRILNAKTARSQVLGGIVWGISMAMMEHTIYDPPRGKIVNDNLADYLVPVNADVPHIDCFFVDERDPHVNAVGAKGVGELGITGSAAAVANAVYHATGKRVRDLPIMIDQLL